LRTLTTCTAIALCFVASIASAAPQPKLNVLDPKTNWNHKGIQEQVTAEAAFAETCKALADADALYRSTAELSTLNRLATLSNEKLRANYGIYNVYGSVSIMPSVILMAIAERNRQKADREWRQVFCPPTEDSSVAQDPPH
jgi:hypothetical protein